MPIDMINSFNRLERLYLHSPYSFMKKIFIISSLLLLWGGSSAAVLGQDREGINTITHRGDGSVLLEDFESYEVGTIPAEWYNQRGEHRPYTYDEENQRPYNYTVQEENGEKFLHYKGLEAKHLNFPLLNKDVNIYETPVLSWKWRITSAPQGGNEDDDNRNDVAASIYVVFDMGHVLFKKVPKSIRYTWSSSLPVGKELSKFFGNQKIVVVGSGTQGTGGWKTFQRNIVEDYKRLFKDDPPETPLAILILSDGNSTKSVAEADYDDIMLLPVQK